jgi:O-antigen ligase
MVFDSSPGHAIYPAYKIGGMWRLNSTFTEASDMVAYLTPGLGCLLWELMTRPLRLWRVLSAGLILLAVFMSLSTTGYLCLGLMFAVAGVVFVSRTVAARRVKTTTVLVALAAILGGSVLFIVSGAARDKVVSVVSMVVLDKQQSDSYRMRTESHVAALRTLEETHYLGAGWGSTRASGTVFTLLASVGVLGLILFSAASVALFVPLFKRPRGDGGKDGLLERSLFSTMLLLTSLVIAGTEPDYPMLWVLFGVAIVAAAPLEGLRRAAPQPIAQGQQVWRKGTV